MSDPAEIIARLHKQNRYLLRKIDRLQTQQLRQEKIDGMNRFQAKRANSQLEVARAVAEKSNRAKTEFLANMSHEIRTPLNIVLGMAELLDGTDLKPAQQQYLQSLRQSGEHLLKLINNILEFSRIESGSVEIEQEPFHLMQLLSTLETMGLHLALKKNIEFRMMLEDGLTDGRLGDMSKIGQILINLVNNAFKFTSVGKVSLCVSSHKTGNGAGVRFVITDSGHGIPADKQDVIFQRFSQVARDQMTDRSGVGLGLAISQRLAIAMGGSIDFHSREKKGSTFELTLPLPPFTLSAPSVDFACPVHSVHPDQLPPLSILAVDDVSLNLQIISHFLAKSPVSIKCVASGREAIKCFDRNIFDLILMDIRMPMMDGNRAVKIIRWLEKRHMSRPVPIIAMTAHAFQEQKKSFLISGFDSVITKPFSRDTLIRTLLGATDQRLKQPVRENANKTLESIMENQVNDGSLPLALVQLIPDFMQMISESYADITAAIEKKDFIELGSVCHTIKGVAGMYGFKNLSALVENIESSASQRNLQSITTLSHSLACYIDQLNQEPPHSSLLS